MWSISSYCSRSHHTNVQGGRLDVLVAGCAVYDAVGGPCGNEPDAQVRVRLGPRQEAVDHLNSGNTKCNIFASRRFSLSFLSQYMLSQLQQISTSTLHFLKPHAIPAYFIEKAISTHHTDAVVCGQVVRVGHFASVLAALRVHHIHRNPCTC